MLKALRVPVHLWPSLFQANGGAFPNDNAAFQQIKVQLRQWGHLLEETPQSIGRYMNAPPQTVQGHTHFVGFGQIGATDPYYLEWGAPVTQTPTGPFMEFQTDCSGGHYHAGDADEHHHAKPCEYCQNPTARSYHESYAYDTDAESENED